jgi:hypothetical protein
LKFLSLKLKQKELMLPDQIFNCTIDTSSHLMLVFRILKKYTCHSGTTYRYLTQTKLSFFSPKKIENRKAKQVLWWGNTSGREEIIRKECRRVDMVKILCTYV